MEEVFLVVLFLDLFLNMFLGGGVVCAGAASSEGSWHGTVAD